MKTTLTLCLSFICLLQGYTQLDSCLYFNNSKITINPALKNEIGAGDFTFEATIKGSENNNFMHLTFLSNRTSSNGGTIFGIHDVWGGSLNKMLYLQYNGINYFVLNNGTYAGSILNDSCHHVAISKKSDSLLYYIDGSFIGYKIINANININAGNYTIGFDNVAGSSFVGNISLVRIWNVVRTPQEIVDGINNGVSVNSAGLLGYWTLSRTGSNTVDQVEQDLTGNYNGVWGTNTNVETLDPSIGSFCCYGVVSPSVPAGLVSNSKEDDLFFYPNPSNGGVFAINTRYKGVFNIHVVDILGQTVYQNNAYSDNQKIDLSSCPTGTYFANIKSSCGTQVLPLMKE